MSKFSEYFTAGVLGGFMSFAGVSHLTHQREEFEASWVEFRFFYGPVLMGWVR
ncbi:hypothetical protein [Corynebacterium sp. KPL3649]|uniref:hypothetical protein n=1 Tax=Corynebacterium sp. KPL3649 TaxID=3135443 RepID=UPI0030C9E8B3